LPSTNVTLADLDTGKSRSLTGELLIFRTRRGGRYRLSDGKVRKKDLDFAVAALPAPQRNWFGLKKRVRF